MTRSRYTEATVRWSASWQQFRVAWIDPPRWSHSSGPFIPRSSGAFPSRTSHAPDSRCAGSRHDDWRLFGRLVRGILLEWRALSGREEVHRCGDRISECRAAESSVVGGAVEAWRRLRGAESDVGGGRR